jgi:hypothetical protein
MSIRRLAIMLRSSWNTSGTKDSTNGKKFIGALGIRRPNLGVRKLGGSDIDWFNPCGDQAIHFIGCIESLNAPNSSNNCKKTSNTFEAGPIMCVSFANERKTQVGWVVVVRRT